MMDNEQKQMQATLAIRLKKVRKQKGMTQADLEKVTDIQQSNISSYEVGNLPITLGVICKFADGLGCSIDYLLGRDASHSTNDNRGRLLVAFEKLPTGNQMFFLQMIEYTTGVMS